MRNAEEARKATQQQLLTMAKECIANYVSESVQEAIELGEYRAVCPLSGFPNPERVGILIVDMLQNEYGYRAKFCVPCPGPQHEDPYVAIEWEEET